MSLSAIRTALDEKVLISLFNQGYASALMVHGFCPYSLEISLMTLEGTLRRVMGTALAIALMER